eukprot:8710670-Pyramimonas_sp.AAC.1
MIEFADDHHIVPWMVSHASQDINVFAIETYCQTGPETGATISRRAPPESGGRAVRFKYQ